VNVGFVGLGMQGGPIASRIIDAGFPTTLWARRPETLEPFATQDVQVAGSLAELGAVSDLVGVCVFDDADVEEVVAGPGGLLSAMRPGSIVAIHSTVNPETPQAMAVAAEPRHVHVLDAPVSGSAQAALERRLFVMVGGDEAVLDLARPVFSAFADPVLYVGAVGTGQLVKLVNNVVLTANWSVVLDAFALGNGFGVSSEMILEVLRHGTASSRSLWLLPDVASLHTLPTRVRPLLGKDSEIAFGVARRTGAPIGLLEEIIHHLWDQKQD
jgi:3-hydroxyisobutyrate dehydrogenase